MENKICEVQLKDIAHAHLLRVTSVNPLLGFEPDSLNSDDHGAGEFVGVIEGNYLLNIDSEGNIHKKYRISNVDISLDKEDRRDIEVGDTIAIYPIRLWPHSDEIISPKQAVTLMVEKLARIKAEGGICVTDYENIPDEHVHQKMRKKGLKRVIGL